MVVFPQTNFTYKIVSRRSADLGMPGDRENVVKLNASHGNMCKFGAGTTDQDNLKLVLGNIRDLYKNALKSSELTYLFCRTAQEGRDFLHRDKHTNLRDVAGILDGTF